MWSGRVHGTLHHGLWDARCWTGGEEEKIKGEKKKGQERVRRKLSEDKLKEAETEENHSEETGNKYKKTGNLRQAWYGTREVAGQIKEQCSDVLEMVLKHKHVAWWGRQHAKRTMRLKKTLKCYTKSKQAEGNRDGQNQYVRSWMWKIWIVLCHLWSKMCHVSIWHTGIIQFLWYRHFLSFK